MKVGTEKLKLNYKDSTIEVIFIENFYQEGGE